MSDEKVAVVSSICSRPQWRLMPMRIHTSDSHKRAPYLSCHLWDRALVSEPLLCLDRRNRHTHGLASTRANRPSQSKPVF